MPVVGKFPPGILSYHPKFPEVDGEEMLTTSSQQLGWANSRTLLEVSKALIKAVCTSWYSGISVPELNSLHDSGHKLLGN